MPLERMEWKEVPNQMPSVGVMGRVVIRVRPVALKTTPLPVTMRLPSGLTRMGGTKEYSPL